MDNTLCMSEQQQKYRIAPLDTSSIMTRIYFRNQIISPHYAKHALSMCHIVLLFNVEVRADRANLSILKNLFLLTNWSHYIHVNLKIVS